MFLDPRFWLAISFIIFLSLIVKYILPKIIRALDGKVMQIANDINQAKLLKQQAEELLKQAKQYHDESLEHANHLTKEATALVQTLLSDSQKMIEEEVNKKLNLVKEKIRQEESNLIREIKSNIILAAIKAVEQKATKINNPAITTKSINIINDINKTIH